MGVINYLDNSFDALEGETVLDVLIREEQDVSYSCQAGICQSCMMIVEDGEVPEIAQKGLKDSQKALNYFLPCQCKPEGCLTVANVDQSKLLIPGKISAKEWLNDHVIRLLIEVDLDFRAGQFVTLWKDEKIGRSYSIASLPQDGYVECHIKVIENGILSQWVKDELKEGQSIGVQGPIGLCFYQSNAAQNILLAAIGTGLAPIMGILKDALKAEHKGNIDLVIGSKKVTGFYLLDTLKDLAALHDNLTIHLACQEDSGDEFIQGDIYQYLKDSIDDWEDRDVYLCGAESFVKKLKKQAFLSGTSMAAIHADSFIAS